MQKAIPRCEESQFTSSVAVYLAQEKRDNTVYNKYQKFPYTKFRWINFRWKKIRSRLLNFGVNFCKNLKHFDGKKIFRRVKKQNAFCKLFFNHQHKIIWNAIMEVTKIDYFDVSAKTESEV